MDIYGVYKITSVLKVETDLITSVAASPTGRSAILAMMCVEIDISYTVCNSPNTENIGSITLISGEAAEPDMNFIDPIFSVLGQLYTV
jgi:hypothetical protein